MLVESQGPWSLCPFTIVWKVIQQDSDDPKDLGCGKCRITVRAEAKVVGWSRFFVDVSATRMDESAQKLLEAFKVRVKEEAQREMRDIK